MILFGTMVELCPISARDQSKLRQFGKKVLRGIILGYAFFAWRIWKGENLVAHIEELEKLDASEIYPGRIKRERSIEITNKR